MATEIVQEPTMWTVRFCVLNRDSDEGQFGCLVEVAYDIDEARKKLLSKWGDYKVKECSLFSGHFLRDHDKSPRVSVPTGRDDKHWKQYFSMTGAIHNGWIACAGSKSLFII